jgi:hypothetical protein
MDLGGLEVLDVAIGLVVLFFLLSTALAAMNEAISNVLGWRAKTLDDALRNLLGDDKARRSLLSWFGFIGRPEAEQTATYKEGEPVITPLWAHWRMKALVRDPKSPQRRRSRPSYLPPRAFSLALAETLAAGAPKKPSPGATDDEIFAAVQSMSDKLPPQLQDIVDKATVNAKDKVEKLDTFRAQVEHLFDDTMERASGWYKRKVQVVLALLATLVVIGLNVDTVHVATKLWNEPALRQSLAAQASQIEEPTSAREARQELESLRLPVGWGANAPDNFLKSIPGWLIAIAALNLGAPFWFDLLSRLARLRGSGLQERPRALSDTTATERPERRPIVIAAEGAAAPEPPPSEPPPSEPPPPEPAPA